MLSVVFERTECTCSECRASIELLENPSLHGNELREKNIELMTLFQFGDIICQSFESFEILLDELIHLENSEERLGYSEAERFSKLVGAVATNTFSLIGKTMVGLNENLVATKDLINGMSEKDRISVNCIKTIDDNIMQIAVSAKQAVLSTEELGLFCFDRIVSGIYGEDKKYLSTKLYEKFRVREHVEILSSLFPSDKIHSETGSLELF